MLMVAYGAVLRTILVMRSCPELRDFRYFGAKFTLFVLIMTGISDSLATPTGKTATIDEAVQLTGNVLIPKVCRPFVVKSTWSPLKIFPIPSRRKKEERKIHNDHETLFSVNLTTRFFLLCFLLIPSHLPLRTVTYRLKRSRKVQIHLLRLTRTYASPRGSGLIFFILLINLRSCAQASGAGN